jgi:hypothetical protein
LDFTVGFVLNLQLLKKENDMTEETMENIVEVEENEPIYYKPRMLNLVATLSGILSWVVLLGFIAIIVGQFLVLKELGQGADWATLIANAQVKNWIYTNMLTPLLNGLSLFCVLQGVAIGLNVLLEIDFNQREPKI